MLKDTQWEANADGETGHDFVAQHDGNSQGRVKPLLLLSLPDAV